ncbi:MAG: S8 family serine peptidase, partial [Thermoplasmata archaeon]
YDEPALTGETSSEIVGGYWSANTPWNGPGTFANSLGWNGTNVTVSIADTGIGNGTKRNTGHADFEGRVLNGTQYGSLTSWADGHAHGTHVAGIVAGDCYEGTGVKYPTSTTSTKYYVGLGVAPDAYLYAQRIFTSSGAWSGPSNWNSFFQDAYNAGVYIHSNSWGENPGDSAYETYDREYDQAVRDSATSTSGDQPMIICVSAGNDGPGAGTIQSPSSGKNVISVGASENYHPDAATYGEDAGVSADNIDHIASFSSRGLEDDGRIKPDIMAPGTAVLSANTTVGSDTLHGVYNQDSRYLWCSGTSQSCPHVSGGAATVVEWWQAGHNGTRPSPAMVKAALINTATDMGTPNIPNGNEGWGRMYLPDLFAPPADIDFYDQDTLLQTGNKSIYKVYVADESEGLKITLVWTDPAAAALANPALVNNLDLKVTAPDNTTTYYGNVFSNGYSTPGTANASSNWDTDSDGFDERNNVECVYIPSNATQSGIYKVEIIADNVATDAVSNTTNVDQDYALVIRGDLSELDDVGVESLNVPASELKAVSVPIQATIKNYGINNQTSPFLVRCIVNDPSGIEVLNSTQTINSLSIFNTVNRNWNFIPADEGRYTITVQTEMEGDDNNANNASTKYTLVPFILQENATFIGTKSDDRFGWNVSFAGDLNGDGYADVIVGAPYNDTADGSLQDAGAAYIFYGPKQGNYSAAQADIKIYGTVVNDHFGWDVSSAGDVNGTYEDVIIGAPGNSSSVPGKAYIFNGYTIKNDVDGNLLATNADVTITGENNGDRFGNSVTGSGNVNNASYDDIVVGAFLSDNNGMTNNGRVYIFYGDGAIPGNANNADIILNGTADNELFGLSVSYAGDMDADDIDDIIIGAPGWDSNRGRCYIYGGFILIPAGSKTYDFSSKAGINKWFYHKNTGTDNPPSTGPDITGEVMLTSYSTIAASDNIRTPDHPDSENSGTSNEYNRHHFKFIIDEPVNAITSLTVLWEGYNTKVDTYLYIWNLGTSSWNLIGTGTSSSSDNTITTTYTTNIANYINTNTGRLDFVVTAKDGAKALWRYLYTDYAKVDVVYNSYIQPSFKTVIDGEITGDKFGWAVNSSGDVNGDGWGDAVAGAPEYENSQGRAYVFFGEKTMEGNLSAALANVTIMIGSPGDKFGYSVGSADYEADGYSDILVGAPYNDTWNGSKQDAGAFYVFEGYASISGLIVAPSSTKSGENAFDNMGWSVSNAMDMNDDNYNDLIVGAPYYDNGTTINAGKAYVFTTVIPEFSNLAIPVVLSILVLFSFKSSTKRARIKRNQALSTLIMIS